MLAAAVCLLGIDGLWVEPNALEVTQWHIEDRLYPPLKIAQLSDLHVTRFGPRERKVVAILRAERPDLVVISGDSIGQGLHYQAAHAVLAAIAQTHPRLGVWLVRGNWEIWHPVKHERQYYQSAGIHFLLNSGALIRPGVWLAGLDDPWVGHPNPQRAMAGAPAGAYVILVFHEPKYFDEIAGQFDLALAGHTHGGQVKLPLIGPFWLSGGSGRYLAGWYSERGSRMYVSRGIGWSHLPIRINCPPEIPIITVGE